MTDNFVTVEKQPSFKASVSHPNLTNQVWNGEDIIEESQSSKKSRLVGKLKSLPLNVWIQKKCY